MIWSKYQTILLGMMLSMAALGSHAAGLQVSPTNLSLPANQRAGIINLTNISNEPIVVQTRVYRWEQDSQGKDILTASNDIVASPPMVKLAAESTQQFRIIRAKPAGSSEEAYRLIIDELPSPEQKPKKGLQFMLRYSLPVFINQIANPEPSLQWQVQNAPNGKTLLTIKNMGTSYAQLSNLTLVSNQKEQKLISGLAGYVLPNKTGQYTLDISPTLLRQGKISVIINGRPTQPEVQFVQP